MAPMTQTVHLRQGPLPQEMRTLLHDYPRDAWPDHPHFARSIQNWLGAHQMFRDLGNHIETQTQRMLDKDIDEDRYLNTLNRYGTALIQNLHGHHSWEDQSYFPELSRADPRFDRGLDVLESDHDMLDKVLDDFTRTLVRAIHVTQDADALTSDCATILGHADVINRFLSRHLADEEDLVVPILLHHKMRG